MPFCTKLRAFLFLFLILSTKVFSQPLSTIYPKNNEVISENSVEFKWNKLNGSVSYQLIIAEDVNFTVNPITNSGILTNSYILNNLQKGKGYFWKIRGFNGTTYSAYSNIAYFINFTPSMVPNIKLWLRADSSCILSGSNVSQWNDLSDQHNNFAQAFSSSQPLQSASIAALNNKKVLTFDGNDEMDGGDILDMNTTSWSYFLFGKSNGGDGTYLGKTIYGGYSNRFALVYLSSQLNVLFNSNLAIIANHAPGNYELISYLIDRNSNTQKIFVNTQPVGQTFADGSSYDHSNDLPFKIGSYNGGPLNLNGDISEIIVYNNSLNDSVKKVVNDYFYYRYFGSPVDLGEDIFVTSPCNPILDAGSRFTSFLWSDGSTSQQLQADQTGEYWVQATDSYGNKSYDTVIVEFPDKLVDTLICYGNSVTLNPQIIGTYLWSTNETTQTITVNTAGDYWVHITSGSCSKYDTVHVSVDDFSLLASLGADDSLCVGNYIGLTSPYPLPGGLSYQWSTLDTNPTISITNSGTYAVTVTNANGCVASDAVYDTIMGIAPSVHFTATIGCSGSTSNFVNHSIPNGSIWEWDFGDGSPHEFTNAASHIFSTGGNFTVRLTVTDGICSNYIDSVVHVPANPIADFSGSTACISNPFTFYDQSTCTEGTITTYDWDFGDGSPHAFTSDASHTYSTLGNMTVSLTIQSSFGCVASVQHQITVVNSAPAPSAFSLYLPADNFSTSNHSIDFAWNSSIGAGTYSLQYSTDSLFNSGVTTISNIGTNYYSLNISTSNTYFWRVISYGICGDFYISDVFSFTIFIPSDITGMQQWLKADINVILNGNSVLAWNDCSLNNSDVTQANSSLQPTLLQNVLNGYPVVQFSGTKYLSGGDILNVGNQSWTYFLVGKSNTSTGTYLGKTYYGAAPNRFSLFYNNNVFTAYCDDSYQITYPRTPVNHEIISWKVDRSSTQQFLYFNGTQYASSSTPAASLNITSAFPYTVGSYNDNLFLNGEIAEIIIFNKALSSTEQKTIENYLRFKYAPPVNLGPDIWSSDFCDTTIDASERFTDYIWSTGETTHSIVVNSGGAYSVTATDVFGFTSVDTVIVHKPIITAHDTLVCYGVPVLLETGLSSPYTFDWQPGGSSGSSFNVTAPAEVTLSVSDGVCTAVKQITVSADSFPVLASLGDDILNICSGEQIGLVSGLDTGLTYDWFDGTNHTSDSLFTIPWTSLTHTATLTVTNSRGCTATDQINVTVVGEQPNVAFTSNSGCYPIITSFTDLSTVGGGAFINSRQWNFGDGTVINGGANVTHPYLNAGLQFVTLTITTNKGCKDSLVDTAFVYSKPDVKFSPVLGCEGVAMNFKDQSTSILGNPSQWNWNFGDPSSSSNTAVGDSVFHVFDTAGTYTIHFVVETEYGCTDSVDKTISIRSAPDVGFTYSNVCDGNPVYFNDTSLVPNVSAQIISWLWNFGSGNTNNSPTPVYTFDNAGTYPVVLTVKSINGCTVSDTQQVVVHAIPVADFVADDFCTGNSDTIKDNSSVLLPDTIALWQWDFGTLGTSANQNPVMQFLTPGTYTAYLLVASNAGCVDTTQQTFVVNPSPVAEFTADEYYGEAPFTADFTNSSTGLNNTYLWNFGDGELSNQINVSHTYLVNDTFYVSLVAYNQYGCTDTSWREMTVMPTIADIAVTSVDVVMQGNYVTLSAQLTNMGTRRLYELDILAKAAGGTAFKETWTDFNNPLEPGTSMTYNFNAQYQLSQDQITEYICIEAQIVGINPDDNPENNEQCVTLSKEFMVFQPYPSPAHDYVNFDFILPFADDISIDLYGAKGELVKNVFKGAGQKGLNKMEVDLKSLSLGVYTFRVLFRDNLKILKFVKY